MNGTFYRRQTPATFASWAAQAPDGFVFALKGSRFVTNRRVLAEAGEGVASFVAQGIVELGDKLGPINWQLADTKAYDAHDFGAFLALLPQTYAGVPLRHAVEPRHESFRTPAFVEQARAAGVAIVLGHADKYPLIADPSGGFTYLRLQCGREEVETGYSGAELDLWAARTQTWAEGGTPSDLPLLANAPPSPPGDVFAFFISGAKVRAPAAAVALAARLGP